MKDLNKFYEWILNEEEMSSKSPKPSPTRTALLQHWQQTSHEQKATLDPSMSSKQFKDAESLLTLADKDRVVKGHLFADLKSINPEDPVLTLNVPWVSSLIQTMRQINLGWSSPGFGVFLFLFLSLTKSVSLNQLPQMVGNSLESMKVAASTHPNPAGIPDYVSNSEAVWKDPEEHLVLWKSSWKMNPRWYVEDITKRLQLFELNYDGSSGTYSITDSKGNSVSPDEFLTQVSDGIEDGLRHFNLKLA